MINCYDFDGTIYDGDSSVDFYKYCLKKNKKVLLALPNQLLGCTLYAVKIIDKTKFKEKVFSFLKYIDNIDKYINDFWGINITNIKEWYLKQQKDTDLIISASPEFLLKPLEKIMNFKVIASKVDKNTGRFLLKNCHDTEKVRRLNKEMPKTKINKFYSDSYADKPLMDLAKEAFLVKKNEIIKIDQ